MNAVEERTGMPDRLVLMRHGESEANIINRAVKHGEREGYPEGFALIPDREFRLSARGREQAQSTGPWIAKQYPDGFDAIYVSDHVRAQETAALVCMAADWHQAKIRIDPQLGERNWGRFAHIDAEARSGVMSQRSRDPLHATMPDGETLLETRTRTRVLLERAAREFSGKRILVFSHGEYIEAIWAEVAHLTTEDQRHFFSTPEGDIRNCQVVEFAGSDPHTGEWRGKLRWVRSSCPSSNYYGDWSSIQSKRFSPEELLERVEKYSRIGS